MKRAGIYIRVSTEKQADKVSPEAQEKDSRDYCAAHGYQVAEVYRDTERYRSGKKLVEPSGTRSDRPQFLRMLADIDAGRIDIVIAWREDRLYRNVNRAMLEISERVTKNKVSIELVKETYDSNTAVVKAWAAGIELKAKHDRLMMGISGRLQRGKTWLPNAPYGYFHKDGGLAIQENEAKWIRLIYKRYGEGVPLKEIRQQLINGNAPQRGYNKYVWAISELRHILKYASYYTGVSEIWWEDVKYDIPIPTIVDMETAQAVIDRRGNFKRYPAGNLKALTMAAGLVYCKHCNIRLTVITANYKDRKYVYYHCPSILFLGDYPDGCFRNVRITEVDEEIWGRVWKLIEEPEEFYKAIEKKISELQTLEVDATAECGRLEKELGEVIFERQKVITWARKKIITEDDLEIQLSVLDAQAVQYENDIRDARLLIGGHADKLKELANLYTAEVRAGAEEVTGNPHTPEQAKRQLEYRRKIIHAIVTRVDMDQEKKITVYTDWDLPELCQEGHTNNFCGSQKLQQSIL